MTPKFQFLVNQWMLQCFGAEIAADTQERNHRFLEEALELVQSCGCSVSEAHQLVDYVFNRPVGEKGQEVGGVAVTLAALCNAQQISIGEESERELIRIWQKIEQIRAKQAAKPHHSPLPEATVRDSQSLNELAHEIAEDDSKVQIDSATFTVTGPDGNRWYDSHQVYEPALPFVERAINYLDAAGILKYCPDAPHLVGWDEDDTGETETPEAA